MGTRAVYTFKDADQEFHVYKHHDGYPEGAFEAISNALPHAWALPRFEADEFAAAFVAGNKGDGGGVRLMPCGNWDDVSPGDIQYSYVIGCDGSALTVEAFRVHAQWRLSNPPRHRTRIFAGTLAEMGEWLTTDAAAEV